MADLKILHSIHGAKLGLNRALSLIMSGREVIPGKLSTGAMVRQIEHFDGAVMSTRWTGLKGSDGSAVTPVISVAVGGKVRLTTASAGTANMAVGGAQLVGALNWDVGKGGFLFGASLQTSSLTNLSLFIGMTDNASLEAAFSMNNANLTSNATDAFGFLYDAGATLANWKCVGVANDVDATVIDCGVAPVAATDDVIAIECDASGNATFYLNGVSQGTLAGAVTPGVALTPTVSMWHRSAAAATTTDLDFWSIEQGRASG